MHINRNRNNNFSEIIETGFYNGKKAYVFQVLGNRGTFVNNTALHDVCEFLTSATNYIHVTTSDSLEVVSSSLLDGVGGTGTQSVRIAYLDASGNMQEYIATLNGILPVPLPFNATAIWWMEAASGGSSETGAGNIDIRKVGTPTIIYERISAGANKSMSARFKIPANYDGYLMNCFGSAIGQTMDIRIRSNVSSIDRQLNSRYLFQSRTFLAAGSNQALDLNYLKIPSLGEVKVSVIPGNTTGNPRIDANFKILIVSK